MSDLEPDAAPRRRGRPKGTGIDDKALLREITGLMASDRSLKPTTAIKRCGIDNPSIVRRLREKLKLEPVVPQTQRKGQKPKRTGQARPQTPDPTPPVTAKPEQARVVPKSVATPSQPITPKTAADTSPKDTQKANEAALLAAYLRALQATAVPAFDEERTPPQTPPEPQRADHAPRTQEPVKPSAEPPRAAQPQNATATPFPFGSQPSGMMFPFFPPFMQPFAPKPPPANPMVQNQMEALKLSVEVMTAVTKLQMFAYQSTLGATPFGNMLQAQTMMGQMLLASFAGFAGLGKKPDGK